MLDGIVWLWFGLTAASLLFVTIDIRSTPESPVLKWGFILMTAYTGPIGAFLYVLGCREPLPGSHERYVSAHWRQALGSTMHCVAGDGVGILVGAVIARSWHLPALAEIALEYLLGFGFGWSIFQALFMRDMAGGSYARSLASTFLPELLSMNFLMAGMVPVMMVAMQHVPGSHDPSNADFWFVMSLSLLTGFLFAYPVNSWLVARHLKHGMMTVRPGATPADHPGPAHGDTTKPHAHHPAHTAAAGHTSDSAQHVHGDSIEPPRRISVSEMTLLSFAAFGAGLTIAAVLGAL